MDTTRLSELGAFIRSRRDNLSPEDVGIIRTTERRGQRKTPGLRREEVATLMGISVDWYTQIEQGKARPSAHVLEQLADALQFTHAERMHLYNLAGLACPVASHTNEQITPALQRVLNYMHPCPAYAMGYCWDILGWNQAMEVVFGTIVQVPDADRNIVYQILTNPTVRQQFITWEINARQMIRQFRIDYGQHVGDPGFLKLIDRLEQTSSLFTQWWKEQEIAAPADIRKEVQHPHLGRLRFEQTAYTTLDTSGICMVLHLPIDKATERKLQQMETG
jgi:transcriptional regulator with XRE-family HTH domain